VGPITFYGLVDAAHRPPQEFVTRHGLSPAWKTVTAVAADTQATLTIPQPERNHLALIYGDFGRGDGLGYKLSDGSSAVRFTTCSPNEPTFSGKGTVGPQTQFNGGFIVGKAGCYRVEVRVAGASRVFNHRLGFGTRGRTC
jgi:hypothetical protein